MTPRFFTTAFSPYLVINVKIGGKLARGIVRGPPNITDQLVKMISRLCNIRAFGSNNSPDPVTVP